MQRRQPRILVEELITLGLVFGVMIALCAEIVDIKQGEESNDRAHHAQQVHHTQHGVLSDSLHLEAGGGVG